MTMASLGRLILAALAGLTGCGVIKPLPAAQAPAEPQPAAPPPAAPAVTWSGVPIEPLGEALPQLENTFAADDRQLVTATNLPWSAVGKLNTGCTATLIDQRLILTAAHCILDPAGRWMASSFGFYPNTIANQAAESARGLHVWYGTRTPLGPGTAFLDDWAIVLLDRDLGSRFGWLGTRDYLPVAGDQVTLVGYSADVDGGNTATTHAGCTIQAGQLEGQITHDCDMTRGASGGPLWSYAWGDPAVVAVQSVEQREGGEVSLRLASYDGSHPNGAVPLSYFFARLSWVVERY